MFAHGRDEAAVDVPSHEKKVISNENLVILAMEVPHTCLHIKLGSTMHTNSQNIDIGPSLRSRCASTFRRLRQHLALPQQSKVPEQIFMKYRAARISRCPSWTRLRPLTAAEGALAAAGAAGAPVWRPRRPPAVSVAVVLGGAAEVGLCVGYEWAAKPPIGEARSLSVGLSVSRRVWPVESGQGIDVPSWSVSSRVICACWGSAGVPAWSAALFFWRHDVTSDVVGFVANLFYIWHSARHRRAPRGR